MAGLCQPRLVRAKAGQGDDPPFVGQDGEPLAEMAGKAVVDEQFFHRSGPSAGETKGVARLAGTEKDRTVKGFQIPDARLGLFRTEAGAAPDAEETSLRPGVALGLKEGGRKGLGKGREGKEQVLIDPAYRQPAGQLHAARRMRTAGQVYDGFQMAGGTAAVSAADLLEHQPGRPDGQGLRQIGQRAGGEKEPFGGLPEALQHRIGPGVEVVMVRPEDGGGVDHTGHKAGVVVLQQGDELGIHGKAITPYLLDEIQKLTGGESLEANIQLVYNNARLASAIASELVR